MKAGQLVRIKRASIGAPKGSIGLITEVGPFGARVVNTTPIYAIHMVGGGVVRRLGADLEVISG